MDAIIQKYKKTAWTADQLKGMEQRWSFTVPEIATLSTNQIFAQLIRDAGYSKGITLMTETEAAAAWLMFEYAKGVKGLPEELKKSDAVIAVDAGGLTVNISAYQIAGAINAGAAVQFDLLVKAGMACGSETLTKLLMQHVEDYANTHPAEHPGGFHGVLRYLGMIRMQVERHLSTEFEAYKATQAMKHITFTLEGRNGITGQDVEKTFRVSRDTIRSWLREIANKIIDKLEEVLNAVDRHIARGQKVGQSPGTRMVTPTGGLLRNQLILDEIHAMYEGRRVIAQMHLQGQVDIGPSDPAVVLGACMRTVPRDPIFSTTFALGMIRDEPLTKKHHGRPAELMDTVDGPYVEDCWCNLTPYNDVGKYETAQRSREAYCRYFVDHEEPVLRDAVYLSDHHIHGHVVTKSAGDLLPGVELYKRIEEVIDIDKLMTYPEKTVGNETSRVVTAKLTVTMQLTQIELEMELVDPSFDEDEDDDDSGLTEATGLGAESSVLPETAFPSTIQRNPIQRTRRPPPLLGMPSPVSTSRRSPLLSDGGVDFDSDGAWKSPPPKRRRSAAKTPHRDRKYKPHGKASAAPSTAGVFTRSRKRK